MGTSLVAEVRGLGVAEAPKPDGTDMCEPDGAERREADTTEVHEPYAAD
ncbi:MULTISPECIES: hypothetical protein [unclassified Paenibacillus]